MSKALVIPSNRPDSLAKFFEAWRGKGGWDHVYVVLDMPAITEEDCKAAASGDRPAEIVSHREIAHALGDDAWIISQEDSACRCFGFLKAWQNKDEWVLTLDDDCLPYTPHANLMDRHIAVLTQQPRWASSVLNTRVRGLPYNLTDRMFTGAASYGLWTCYADLDAKTELSGAGYEYAQGGFFPRVKDTWVLPCGQYVPLSGMNLCISRWALPLFYFPLQGKGQPYRRFDDIWAGVIAKALCDRMGKWIGVGEPFVEHHRASDVRKNLEKESPGIEAHETFWRVIDQAAIGVHHVGDNDSIYAVQQLAGYLEDSSWNYINRLGKALRVWANLFCKS
jgi:reversibly glycosylated polypeptide/UDP-arabinopyranose mutase